MKKLLIACSMISAGALIACADTTVQGSPKTQELSWFDVSTTATNHGTLAVAENSDALCEIVGNKFEIDSDIDNLVTFTTANDSPLTQPMAKVTFNLDAAVVPNGALQQFNNDNKPKVAFALYQTNDTTTNFVAWVGGQNWIPLTGAYVPNEGAAYALAMEFDNRDNGKKVKFSVGAEEPSTALTYNSENWIAYNSSDPVTNAVAVNFVGCGKVSSFEGKQLQVIGEIIVIGGKGTVEVNNEAKAAFAETVPTGKTVDQFLADNAKTSFTSSSIDSKLTVAEAYALGLIVKSGTQMAPISDGNGALTVKADAQASTEGGIPVKLNIQPPTDSGATVKYQLQGSVDGTDYVNIGGEETVQSAIKIPTSNIGNDKDNQKYRYFKVKTILTLENAPTAQE